MTSRRAVDEFLAQRRLALAGASRSGKKFGNTILKELTSKGYEVFPVHPEAGVIDGVACVRSLSELPDDVGGLVVVVPPAESEKLVRHAKEAGIRRVWLQQGAESEQAVSLAEEAGITAVHGECILMFAEPAGFAHRFHRWIWGILGRLPK